MRLLILANTDGCSLPVNISKCYVRQGRGKSGLASDSVNPGSIVSGRVKLSDSTGKDITIIDSLEPEYESCPPTPGNVEPVKFKEYCQDGSNRQKVNEVRDSLG